MHEIKYDGYRMLCRIDDGEAQLISRNAKDWTGNFTAVARALARLPVESRGSTAKSSSMDADGRSSFQALQNALSGGQRARRSTYFAFDLLYLNGFDLRKVALAERKRVLQELLSGCACDGEVQRAFRGARRGVPAQRLRARARRHGLQARRPALSDGTRIAHG